MVVLIFKRKKKTILHKPFSVFLEGSVNLSAPAHISEFGIRNSELLIETLKVADRSSLGYNNEGK